MVSRTATPLPPTASTSCCITVLDEFRKFMNMVVAGPAFSARVTTESTPPGWVTRNQSVASSYSKLTRPVAGAELRSITVALPAFWFGSVSSV